MLFFGNGVTNDITFLLFTFLCLPASFPWTSWTVVWGTRVREHSPGWCSKFRCRCECRHCCPAGEYRHWGLRHKPVCNWPPDTPPALRACSPTPWTVWSLHHSAPHIPTIPSTLGKIHRRSKIKAKHTAQLQRKRRNQCWHFHLPAGDILQKLRRKFRAWVTTKRIHIYNT